MGTAQRQGPINTAGVGMNTSMNIMDRPTTQQGLSGGRPGTGAQGPARQVQDESYFLRLLQAKQAEITKEITQLKEGMDKTTKDNAAYGSLEKKYEVLTGEMRSLAASTRLRQSPPRRFFTVRMVRARAPPARLGRWRWRVRAMPARARRVAHDTAAALAPAEDAPLECADWSHVCRRARLCVRRALQGRLADYNLLLDRQRVNKEARDIAAECGALRQANAQETHRVDDIFNHRVQLEGQARGVEDQLHAHHQVRGWGWGGTRTVEGCV